MTVWHFRRRGGEFFSYLLDSREIRLVPFLLSVERDEQPGELGALRTDDAGGLTRRRARRDHVVHLEKHTHQGVVTHGESMGV